MIIYCHEFGAVWVDKPPNGKTVVEEVGSILSSVVQTGLQLQRSGKQMAKLRTPLAGQTEITAEEFVIEQKGDPMLRKSYEQVGEVQRKQRTGTLSEFYVEDDMLFRKYAY